MSDTGETQISEKDLGLTSPKKIDAWRDTKINMVENMALELAWSKSITGKNVVLEGFDKKVVWGVELQIPLIFDESVQSVYVDLVKDISEDRNINLSDEEIATGINENKDKSWFNDVDKIQIPKNIKRIRIVNFKPQEALPKNLRNIDSTQDKRHDSNQLIKLTDHPSENLLDKALLNINSTTKSSIVRSQALQDLLYDVFNADPNIIDDFRKSISKDGVEEVLIINGHGGEEDLDVIGEETFDVKGKDSEFQSAGNRIKLENVIDHYKDDKKIGAILVTTCYLGNDVPKPTRIKIFRAKGHTGYGHPSRSLYKHVASTPNTTLIVNPEE